MSNKRNVDEIIDIISEIILKHLSEEKKTKYHNNCNPL